MTTKYRAFTPSGERIIGTLEEIQGCAYAEFYGLDDDGEIRPEYEGETKVYWDSQRPVIREGQLVYLDEICNEWLHSQITFVPVEPELPKENSTWKDNNVQFPRLIAELEAAAAFTPEVLDALASSMDLELSDVNELIERAVTSWDHIVCNTPAPASVSEQQAVHPTPPSWNIFENDTHGFRVEKVDDAEVFKSDEEALNYVCSNPIEARHAIETLLKICNEQSERIWDEIINKDSVPMTLPTSEDSVTEPCACPSCRSSDIHFINGLSSLQNETGVALDLNKYQCRSCNFTFFV